MKLSELEWVNIVAENAPVLNCNYCAKRGPSFGFLMADIPIATGSHYSLVMCSMNCKTNFMSNKASEGYLNAQIKKMKRIHRMQAIKKM